jgi:hypothetical protein
MRSRSWSTIWSIGSTRVAYFARGPSLICTDAVRGSLTGMPKWLESTRRLDPSWKLLDKLAQPANIGVTARSCRHHYQNARRDPSANDNIKIEAAPAYRKTYSIFGQNPDNYVALVRDSKTLTIQDLKTRTSSPPSLKLCFYNRTGRATLSDSPARVREGLLRCGGWNRLHDSRQTTSRTLKFSELVRCTIN